MYPSMDAAGANGHLDRAGSLYLDRITRGYVEGSDWGSDVIWNTWDERMMCIHLLTQYSKLHRTFQDVEIVTNVELKNRHSLHFSIAPR